MLLRSSKYVSGGFSKYHDIWLRTPETRALEELENLLETQVPDLTDNSLGSFGYSHDNQHVTELRLFQSYFNPKAQLDRLPESIGNFEDLHTLDVSHNLLTNLPESITQLLELENFYLDYNNFREFPNQLLELSHLRQLNFDENLLSLIPETISQIPYLQSLHIAGNRFQSFPVQLGTLQYLRRLDLSRNLINQLDYETLDRFSGLYVLDLRDNLLPETTINKLLAYLKLSGKKRRKFYLKGKLSDYENPFSLRNLRKRIKSDPHIEDPKTDEELEKLAITILNNHLQRYRGTDGILT